MALYEMSEDGALIGISVTTFADEQVKERAHLQRALRDNISVLDSDLLVVAEEFGEFEVRRRIDLLCVDRTGSLVVVELKRTEDGGHMELQALRYAAMVSTMTFDQLVLTYERHLQANSQDPETARQALAEWLDAAGGENAVLDRKVRIILAAAGFDTQITTSVLWLNDVYGLDISCVRLVPHRISDKLLLDVQQVIPLPGAAEFTVQLRNRERAAQISEASSGRDYTRYVIASPDGRTSPLNKRKAVLAMVQSLHAAGVKAEDMASALPGHPRFFSVNGELEGDALVQAFATAHNRYAPRGLERFYFEHPLHDNGNTWVLSKQWGIDTADALDALQKLAPTGFGYEEG